MKKFLFLAAFLLLTFLVEAQKNKPFPDTTAAWQTYRNAIAFNDLLVAKQALFHIISVQPENTSVYDSLAGIYFMMGAYQQAIMAAEKAPVTPGLKDIRAYSYRNLGDLKTALQLFEELFAATGSPETGYQVAGLQYSLKRMGECEATLNKVLSHPDAPVKKVVITLDRGESQEVTYLAAAENLKGVMLNEMGKTELAKSCFERALASEPEFILAKNNLDSLKNPAPAK